VKQTIAVTMVLSGGTASSQGITNYSRHNGVIRWDCE